MADRATMALDLAPVGPAPDAVVDWVKRAAAPLGTVEAGHGFADLAALGAIVGDARIVALGEATHGSREFFQMKHRVLEYLVAKKGFTVFAIETHQPEARAVDAYVLRGEGDARTALAGMNYWPCSTEEVLDMIEWMRRWNADPRHARKVRFAGFDIQSTAVAHASVARFLHGATPAEADALLVPLAPLDPAVPPGRAFTAAEHDAIAAGIAAIARVMDGRRKDDVARVGLAAWEDVRHDLVVLGQASDMRAATSSVAGFDARDRAMAANVDWLVAHQPKGTRMVLWAHNGHVAGEFPPFANLGSRLRETYGQALVSIGFAFAEGSFQALDATLGKVAEFTVGPPRVGVVGGELARAKIPRFLLDLRRVPRGPVAEWFDALHPVREIGAIFTSEAAPDDPQRIARRYDAIVFIEKTTRARPIEQ